MITFKQLVAMTKMTPEIDCKHYDTMMQQARVNDISNRKSIFALTAVATMTAKEQRRNIPTSLY